MTKANTNRKFRVEEATRKDAGRGIARLHTKVMKDLDITVGDVIVIQGKRKTASNGSAKKSPVRTRSKAGAQRKRAH